MSIQKINQFYSEKINVGGVTGTEGTCSAAAEKKEDSALVLWDNMNLAIQPKRFCASKIDNFIFKTTSAEKKKILDLQFAKLFYACNIPFSVVEKEHMKKLVQLLRGNSYTHRSRHNISTHLLHEECEDLLISELKG